MLISTVIATIAATLALHYRGILQTRKWVVISICTAAALTAIAILRIPGKTTLLESHLRSFLPKSVRLPQPVCIQKNPFNYNWGNKKLIIAHDGENLLAIFWGIGRFLVIQQEDCDFLYHQLYIRRTRMREVASMQREILALFQ
ncbi:MAG: hypothetical protein S4CHLAM81_15010 [Chlamydiales bacterium]|nr:hypothetical protein [Chlamydiales bacterium]MCH9636270.1 hypothetical protein [Chlamydiales bacterium]